MKITTEYIKQNHMLVYTTNNKKRIEQGGLKCPYQPLSPKIILKTEPYLLKKIHINYLSTSSSLDYFKGLDLCIFSSSVLCRAKILEKISLSGNRVTFPKFVRHALSLEC